MGAILKPAPAMGIYKVEVRQQSFYLTRVRTDDDAPHRTDRHSTHLPAAEVTHVLAALDQVTSHRAWREWADSESATVPLDSDEWPRTQWTVQADANDLTVDGPWAVYEDDASLSGEIPYSALNALREALSAHPKQEPA